MCFGCGSGLQDVIKLVGYFGLIRIHYSIGRCHSFIFIFLMEKEGIKEKKRMKSTFNKKR